MRQALGRGLEALIPKTPEAAQTPPKPTRVPLDKIRPNHLQPRKNFDPERLGELAASIKEHGLAQPIVVSFDAQTQTYELIAGERRMRATELAGLKEIEVVVRAPADDRERLAIAMVENLQREDLNQIEEALGYLRLMKEFQVSQSQLAQVMSKSKSVISNTLRLLDLPEEMQKALQFGTITEGHARALLMIENPLEKQRLFKMITEQKLSVRMVEDLARKISEGLNMPDLEPEERLRKPASEKPADIRDLEANLQQQLGTKVDIRTKKDPSQGTVTIHFYSLQDFDRIVSRIKS